MLTAPRELATKTVYAAIGAPVVATRAVKQYRDRVAEYSGKLVDKAEQQFDTMADEGEKIAKKLQGGQVVEEIQHRVDLDKVQDRVEKLRDQLEGALHSWRESFAHPEEKAPAKKVEVETAEAKPVAKKTAARKPAAKKPAAKKTTTTAKKTTTRKPAAKKPATASK